MFSKALSKYNFLRRNQFKDKSYNLSSLELFEIILNKRFYYKKNIINFLVNLVFFSLSILTIIKCKLLGIKKANYLIINNNSLEDIRSKAINSELNVKNYLNIVRSQNTKILLKSFFYLNNVISHQSIIFFSSLFVLEKKKNFKEKFNVIHKCNKNKNKIYLLIFNFLDIKKFITIDDYREIQNFIKICKKLNIFSICYMHARFSKYRVSLKYGNFNKYIVWSDYFKKKLLEINPNYKNKVIVSNFRKFRLRRNNFKTNQVRILYFLDTMMDTKKVISYLEQIKANEKIKIFFRLKSNQVDDKYFISYLKKNNFTITIEENLEKTVKKYKPNIFMATNSNALIESYLYDCIPVLIKTKNDYSFDLIKENLVFYYSNNKNFSKFLFQIINKKNIKYKIFKKIWFSESKQNLKKIFKKYNF